MALVDVLLGRSAALDEAEEALGKPLEAEEYDLSLHVQRCAQRWAMSYRASKCNSAQLAQIRLFLLLAAIIAAAYIPPVQRTLEKLNIF
jgi:hypothetical protein